MKENDWKERVEEITLQSTQDEENDPLGKGEKFWKSMLEKHEGYDKNYVKIVGLVTDSEPNKTIRQYQWQELGKHAIVKISNLIFKLSLIPAVVEVLLEGTVPFPF